MFHNDISQLIATEKFASLSLTEKHQLWLWMGEQIAAAEMRETRANYRVESTNPAQLEILAALNKLSPIERLTVIETALHSLQKDLQQPMLDAIERKQHLAEAAKLLRQDYIFDDDLAAFTSLDGEPIL